MRQIGLAWGEIREIEEDGTKKSAGLPALFFFFSIGWIPLALSHSHLTSRTSLIRTNTPVIFVFQDILWWKSGKVIVLTLHLSYQSTYDLSKYLWMCKFIDISCAPSIRIRKVRTHPHSLKHLVLRCQLFHHQVPGRGTPIRTRQQFTKLPPEKRLFCTFSRKSLQIFNFLGPFSISPFLSTPTFF